MDKTSDLYVAQQKMRRVLSLIILLCKKRQTITQLARHLNTTERTVYRYIDLLKSLNIELDKDLDGQWFIVDFNCPVCGQEVSTLKKAS